VAFPIVCIFSAGKKESPLLERRGNRMIVTVNPHSLTLSLEDFVAAVSACFALAQNQEDRQIIKTLQTSA